VIRSFDHAQFPRERLLGGKRQTLTVVLPAREVADTVGAIVERILGLDGLVDQVLVVDADSADGTADVARAAGAEVVSQAELGGVAGEDPLPAARAFEPFGPVDGKGDAMWRSLVAARGDLVAFVDADTRDFQPQFVNGLFGPLLCEPGVRFVKAAYRRPFTVAGGEVPDGGGRVSQLTARPLLDAFYPPLGELGQPLAGEIAAPRELLERLPFATRYAVETAMLIDVLEREGAGAIAECDLGERRNAHQPLPALAPMAAQVVAVIGERLRRDGRLRDGGPQDATVYRPPLAELAAATSGGRPLGTTS